MASRKQGGKPAGAGTGHRPAEPVRPGSANRGFASIDPERQGYTPGAPAKPPKESGTGGASAPAAGAPQQGRSAGGTRKSGGAKGRSSRSR